MPPIVWDEQKLNACNSHIFVNLMVHPNSMYTYSVWPCFTTHQLLPNVYSFTDRIHLCLRTAGVGEGKERGTKRMLFERNIKIEVEQMSKSRCLLLPRMRAHSLGRSTYSYSHPCLIRALCASVWNIWKCGAIHGASRPFMVDHVGSRTLTQKKLRNFRLISVNVYVKTSSYCVLLAPIIIYGSTLWTTFGRTDMDNAVSG